MDKQRLNLLVENDIADIAMLQGGIFQDPNYFPPTILPYVFKMLPDPLKGAIEQYDSNEEKSIALLSSLTTVAAGLHNIRIPFRKKEYHCNLFQVIVGPPASNKGITLHSRVILDKVQIRLKRQYLVDKAKHLKALHDRKEKENQKSIDSLDVKESEEINIESESSSNNNKYNDLEVSLTEPNPKHIILPSDISSASLVDLIEKNDGFGLIFDSEAQTILNTFKQDWGANLASMLLKTFENEPLELARKSMKSMISIPEPRFSVLLTGNPEHLFGLVKSITNGLYSRFCIYQTQKIGWMDIKQNENNKNYLEGYGELSTIVGDLNESLSTGLNIQFRLTGDQIEMFNKFFGSLDGILSSEIDTNFSSVVKRMGVICYRICSLLGAMRNHASLNRHLECSNEDFAVALSVCSTLLKHSVYTFMTSAETNLPLVKFYSQLPTRFTRKEAQIVASDMEVKVRTMDLYLKELISNNKLRKASHGIYEKNTPAILQYLQYEDDDQEIKAENRSNDQESTESIDDLTRTVDSIEKEPVEDTNVAQIAILRNPLFEESDDDVYEDVIDSLPQFEWLSELQKHTEYDNDAINRILQKSGYETYMKRLSQITLAIQQGKLNEIVEGWYELPHDGFDSHSNL
jgi:hypothetical protein